MNASSGSDPSGSDSSWEDPEDQDFYVGDPATIMRDQIVDALVADEVQAILGPHIVECRVIGTDLVSYVGPFPTGVAALCHAEQEAGRSCAEDRLEYMAIALTAPPDIGAPHDGGCPDTDEGWS